MKSLTYNDYLILTKNSIYENVNSISEYNGTFYSVLCPKFNLYEKSY